MRRIIIILIVLGLAGGTLWYFKYRKMVTTGEQPTGVFKAFFPIGGSATDPNLEGQIGDIDVGSTPNQTNTSAFKQLTVRPISGFVVFSKTKTISIPSEDPKGKPTLQTITDNFVRYVARQSGFVYEIKNNETPLQISNIFIPSVYESYFTDNNQSATLRFLKEDTQTIGSYVVPIPEENEDGTRTQKEGVFISDNITSVATSPDTKEIVTLKLDKGDGTIVTSSSLEKNKKELIKSPLKEWLIFWPEKSSVYTQTKASGTVEGFLYKIEQNNRRFKRILGNVRGLTTNISPSGNFIVYSESSGTSFKTKILNTKTGNISSLGLSILPEKCTWFKNDDLICAGNTFVEQGVYPDVWYAGLVSFSDQIYRIYTANNIFDVLYKNEENSFDITNLQIDESRDLLFFIDKKTSFLWQFSL